MILIVNYSMTDQYSNIWAPQESVSYTSYMPEEKSSSQTNTTLFKTKLWRHFQAKGFCNLQEKCNFAHGYEELKKSSGASYPSGGASYYGQYNYTQKPAYQPKQQFGDSSNSIYYKTQLCRNFKETGQCQYGDHCKFAHGAGDLNPMPPKPTQSQAYTGYQAYAAPASYSAGYYQYDAAPTATYSDPYGYAQNYTYPAEAPIEYAPAEDAQQYGYNYTPDATYYTGYDMGGASAPPSSESETMNQYYAQNTGMMGMYMNQSK